MQCLNCGTIAPDDARYCASCGSMVSDPAAPTMLATATEQEALLTTIREQFSAEYEVERELGRGGMAIVFRATERELRRPVALKILPPELALVASLAERFKREARMAASLDHPNIIPVFRVGQMGGFHFIAMKFVEGRALDSIIASHGKLPIPAALAVLRSSVAALAFAHEKGIVHRDIKGGNILIDREGRVVVSDFGIARAVEDSAMTASGAVIGTPYFMSPEQCAGTRVGPASDQYSIGIVAFQMITGAVPFTSDTLPGIMQHHFFTPVPDMTLSRPDIPRGLVEVVNRSLAKKPEERFADTYDMLGALEAIPLVGIAEGEDEGHGYAILRELAGGDPASAGPPSAVHGPTSRPGAGRAGSTARPPTAAGGGSPSRPASSGAATVPPARGAPAAGSAAAVPATRMTPRSAPAAPGRKGPRAWPWIAATFVLLGAGGAAVAFGLLDKHLTPGGAVRHAIRHYQAGQRGAARAEFQKVATAHPELPVPHIYLGRMAREEGDSVTARRELEAAVQFAPDNPLAQREMASLYLWQKDYENARRLYSRTLHLDPGDRNAMGFLACTLRRMGKAEDADRFFARAGNGSWNVCAARQ
jgi:tetratricopeptide (TPR) repeat protein/predicted Ser/Thr protein kinase